MEVFGSRWKNHWQRIAADWKSRVSDDDVVLIAGDTSGHAPQGGPGRPGPDTGPAG